MLVLFLINNTEDAHSYIRPQPRRLLTSILLTLSAHTQEGYSSPSDIPSFCHTLSVNRHFWKVGTSQALKAASNSSISRSKFF